jgi:hypothetical protein
VSQLGFSDFDAFVHSQELDRAAAAKKSAADAVEAYGPMVAQRRARRRG